MNFRRRVPTIYAKELKDILRDRRTLVAMLVVPIVLYPLLTLGSVQAVSFQAASLEAESFSIGVIDDRHASDFARLVDRYNILLEHGGGDDSGNGGGAEADEPAPEDPASVETSRLHRAPKPGKINVKSWRRFESVEQLEDAIRRRVIQVGIVLDRPGITRDPGEQNHPTFYVDMEEVRSASAYSRLTRMLQETNRRWADVRLDQLDLPLTMDQPFVWKAQDLSAPPSILGQILPLILVLMTITGAIYPAIDLTAGERERGTLETLMVCPVRVIDLIVGKFLVVTTVAMMGATLNLVSVSATVYFGGFGEVLSSGTGSMPIGKMVLILLCLVPFAILMSAIMIAVCSYARTFKEAQNYVTPVILAVLVPGGIAAFPATRLEGVMLVMPVGNMVLFAREMLLGADIPLWHTAAVLLSTMLYAAAAVAIAASVFGRETVVFADTASLRTSFDRNLIKPAARPTISMALMVVALLFPAWFFIQTAIQPHEGEDPASLLRGTALWMPILFVLLPLFLAWYWKFDLRSTFSLRPPPARMLLAALLIGISAWVPARELVHLQNMWLGTPPGFEESNAVLQKALDALAPWQVLVVLAALPAICEEMMFRGFLLSGLSSSARKWTCIISSAVVFGAYHFLLFRLPVTTALGIVLGLLCWQSRSILPGMFAHFLHNGLAVSLALFPALPRLLGLSEESGSEHLPWPIVLGGCVVFGIGLTLVIREDRRAAT